MNQPAINSRTARTTCGFVVLILLSSVFTFIVGCGGEGATSSGQASHLEPGTEDTVYLPGIADVAFIDSSHAWAINQKGTALYEVRESAPPRKHATEFGSRPLISFVDQKTGFAFARRRLWRTTDAGQSWQKVSDFDQANPALQLTSLSKLHFVDKQHGWLVDVFGVWWTEDGGSHWQRVFTTAESKEVDELRQVSFRGSQHAVVAARRGIYLTLDSGRNWKLTNRNNEFLAVYSLDERTSWAWGASLQRTDDGGNTWSKLYHLNGRTEIHSTHFINRNEGWAAGVGVPESFGSIVRNPSAPQTQGILLHTKDGGKTWDHAPVPTDAGFHRVAFSDSNHGWLLSMDRLYRTADGGLTWATALEVNR